MNEDSIEITASNTTIDSVFFYGGSFNPPHIAHVFAATYLTSIFPNALVLVAPILRHAFDKELLDFELRLQMLKLAFQNLASIQISTIEKDLNLPKSRTIACVHELRKRYPRAKVNVVIGSDLVSDLPRWKDAQELQKAADFFVFPRPGYPYTSPRQTPFLVDISSSQLRQNIAKGQLEPCEALIPARVLEFIVQKALYCKV